MIKSEYSSWILIVSHQFCAPQVIFCCQEKMCELFLFFIAVVLIDLKVTLFLYILDAGVFTYRLWFLIGFANVTPTIIFATLSSHFFVACTLLLIIYNLRSNIAAEQNSGKASSLMLGFRHVLRGVCDGDVLLDRRSCLILDDASSLERLLKSNRRLGEWAGNVFPNKKFPYVTKYTPIGCDALSCSREVFMNWGGGNRFRKLCKTSFLDLFLDSPSRENFLKFLANDKAEETRSTVRGLRVSLQGADGPVSVDLFHTQIPSQDSTSDYCFSELQQIVCSDSFER